MTSPSLVPTPSPNTCGSSTTSNPPPPAEAGIENAREVLKSLLAPLLPCKATTNHPPILRPRVSLDLQVSPLSRWSRSRLPSSLTTSLSSPKETGITSMVPLMRTVDRSVGPPALAIAPLFPPIPHCHSPLAGTPTGMKTRATLLRIHSQSILSSSSTRRLAW